MSYIVLIKTFSSVFHSVNLEVQAASHFAAKQTTPLRTGQDLAENSMYKIGEIVPNA